ncbi:prepilin peptidase [Intestinibacter bartlettii]|uniref:Prepilin peptidase n=1 Tax=Intestinibacter bartlettii TaxID=261299 RepID=A0ABS6DWU7_9FIRM|nr:prepilin peptidase [Intestinibacter bartlettii]MBU5336321.1 prepilin peptidase [Intestinibacter bartlettii]
MIFIIIAIFLIISCIENKLIYLICKEMKPSLSNSIIVYLTSIITSLLIYNKYEITLDSISYFLLIPFIVVISIIDFRTSFVYDITVVSGIIVQSVVFILSKIPLEELVDHCEGLIIGLLLSFFMCKLTKAIGEGDIGFYGLCCFVLGAKHSLNVFALSFLLTSIFGILIILKQNRINLKVRVPFTPFISMATILIMLTQYDIIKIYFKMINNNL